MAHTTGTVHVRGVLTSRLLAAVDAHLGAQGLVRLPGGEAAARAERAAPALRRIALRRDGRWLTLADADVDALDAWGEALSSALARSVLTLWTWDGEASVVAKRWKRGRLRATLTLLQEAYAGDDGRPRAPAGVLSPWLARAAKAAFLREGLLLSLIHI